MHLRPRVSNYGAVTGNPRRGIGTKRGLPSFKALNGRIYGRGTGKAQCSKIGYFDNRAKEARNAVAGDKQRAWTNPAFDKEAQLLQEDCVRMPPGF